MRLDERLVQDGLVESRSVAQRLIMAGQVRVDGQLCDKASARVRAESSVELTQQPRFVSRGGDKLCNAIDELSAVLDKLDLHVDGACALDVGASTGGFTDCLLQRGAAQVIAVDVGYGQLHPRLRNDTRVTVMERTNARHLTPDQLPYEPDMIVCDASFISLAKLLPGPLACMAAGYWGMLLCKPQFEAGRGRVGSGGVVRDDAVRQETLDAVIASVQALGARVEACAEARPRGPKGNVEYLLLIRDASLPESS